MNNKGQTLALFVIIIPLILLLFIYIVDIGNLYLEKRKINNTLEYALEYKKENKNVEEYINKNIDDVDEIIILDDEIIIKKNKKGIMKDYYLEISKKG